MLYTIIALTLHLLAAACQARLGIEDGRIPDNQLTASTVWGDGNWGPSNGRLNHQTQYPTGGSWSAKYNDANQWIQVDLGVLHSVTGVLTQGRAYNVDDRFSGGGSCCPHWVTNFKVQYSSDGMGWRLVQSTISQSAMIFVGNTDQTTVVTNLFPTLVEASFIRILPTKWNEHISLRFEVLGCQENIKVKWNSGINKGITRFVKEFWK
ncbi:lactadherin-like [Amphiura filiformis]|uniref:lactadherin-like n=1 Tax=Amphiura filiformis TaxID=82378 RepID=UPI003B219303